MDAPLLRVFQVSRLLRAADARWTDAFLGELDHGIGAVQLSTVDPAHEPALRIAKLAVAAWILLVDTYVSDPELRDSALARSMADDLVSGVGPSVDHPAARAAAGLGMLVRQSASTLPRLAREQPTFYADLARLHGAVCHTLDLQEGRATWSVEGSVPRLAHDFGVLIMLDLDRMASPWAGPDASIRCVAHLCQCAMRLANDLDSAELELALSDRTSGLVHLMASGVSEEQARARIAEHARVYLEAARATAQAANEQACDAYVSRTALLLARQDGSGGDRVHG